MPSESAALAKWILTEVFHFSTMELYAGKDITFPTNDWDRLENIISRLRQFEPIQYIIGRTYFCGLSLEVTPDVLIPRPETEELVDWIASNHSESGLRILDIGTGSGCIPIALAHKMNSPQIASWDISAKALAVAKKNAALHHAAIEFRQVDILQQTVPSGTFDILISNPPYIAEKEKIDMSRNVLDWEPSLALFVHNDDPLLFYRKIAQAGRQLLSSKGHLYFEINRAYGEATAALLHHLGYQNIELQKDLSGNDRMIKATKS